MVGPVLGGWLTDVYGWPWIFYINVPVGILGTMLSILVLADPPHLQRGLARIDVVGIVLLAVGLTTLQLVLERGERENWFDSSFIMFLTVVTLITLAALVVWELITEEPVINLRLLKNIPFTSGSILGLLFGITLFGSTFISLFSKLEVWWCWIQSNCPWMLIILGHPIAGRLQPHRQPFTRQYRVALMMWGYLDMSGFNLETSFMRMMPGFLLTGAGMSFMFGPMSAQLMRPYP